MSQYATIRYEVDDPIATITLSRPERLNAWTTTMAGEVNDALTRAGDDKRVVGIIVTGEGRAFCSGGDLKDLTLDDLRMPRPASASVPEDAPRSEAKVKADAGGPLSLMRSLDKPVIAAVNGPAVGMGAVIALWADLRFMAEDAMLTLPFAQLGTVAEGGSSWLLSKLIGSAAAFDLLLSGRRIDAAEALSLGLVNRVLPTASLIVSARDYVETLARCSPGSMATIKRQIYDDQDRTLAEASSAARTLLAACVDSGDIQEGWQAFVEKRPPRYARLGVE